MYMHLHLPFHRQFISHLHGILQCKAQGKFLCQNGCLIIDTLCRMQEMLRLQGHRNRAIAGRIFRMMR